MTKPKESNEQSSLTIIPSLLGDIDQAIALCDCDTLNVIESNAVFSDWYLSEPNRESLENIFEEQVLKRIRKGITKKRIYRFKIELNIQGRIEHIDFNSKVISPDDVREYVLLQGSINSTEAHLIKMIEHHTLITEQNKKSLASAISKAEAAKASKAAKSMFLASISHELRTPMNGILGMVQQFYKTSLTLQQTELINTIESSGDQLLSIINQVLDFSKIEANEIELHHSPTDIKKLVNNVISICHNSVNTSSNLTVFPTFIGPSIPNLLVDDVRLKQVLINLINNAIKFTSKGQVEVEVNMLSSGPKNGRLSFSVIDTGIGMEQEKIAGLFKPFTQHDSSTTKVYGGTGLGLSISQQLIKMMGSEIKVTSVLNQGSKFSFDLSLPVSEDQSDLDNNPKQVIENYSFKGKTILVVDDAVINRKIATMVLDKSEAKILIAVNGEEAVEQFKSHHIDIILMDCLMPIMDGFEAAKKIRALESAKQHVPIIALTASASSEVAEECEAAGMDDIMLKPFKFDLLLNKINTIMSDKSL